MKLTEQQIKAFRMMSEAMSALSDAWPDESEGETEFGQLLINAGLIPNRDVSEVASEFLFAAYKGELIE